jgi:ABC-type sugar transport system substrate-binding protein
VIALVAAAAVASAAAAGAAQTAAGTGHPFTGPDSALKPFKPSTTPGAKPTKLPLKVAWESQSGAAFWLQYANAINLGLAGSKIRLLTGNANSDPTQAITDLRSFVQSGVGGLVTVPVGGNQPLVPIQAQAIAKGDVVIGELAGPADQVIAVNQYQVGYTQGQDAVKFIKQHMGGKASVLYFNADNVSPLLIPRKLGAIAALNAGGPGIQLVQDLSILPDVTMGEQDMATALQANPAINVVLGDDESVLGAVHAYQLQNKLSSLQYASGVDGSPDALAAIQAGNTPYKVDYGFNYGVMGLVTGQSIKRWYAGLNIAQVADFKPFAMNSAATITAYARAASNPKPSDVSKFITLYGSVSYAKRGSYVNYTP